MKRRTRLRVVLPAVLWFCTGLCWCAVPARCQDTGDQGTMTRGERAEIAVTVREASGQIITTPASVKLLKNGVPSDQSSASQGRAFFIPRGLGEFTVVVDAAGYKSEQKDVSISVPGQIEVDVYLQRDTASNESSGVPGKPILAPKAQEALSKGTQAIREGKLDEAQKYLDKAVKLAPSHPDVLYAQGMLFMRQSNWVSAEEVLQKSNQVEPNQARVLAALGMTFCNERKYEQAIPLLERSLQLEPTSGWETSMALAKAYYYHEQYDQALKMAELAHGAARSPVPQVELLLAQCLTAEGRYEDSAKVLRDFLQSSPNAPETATARRWLQDLTASGKIQR